MTLKLGNDTKDMTNKEQLQEELKKKIKEGIKPSDIKKQLKKPKSNEDEGYLSEEEENIIPTSSDRKIKDLQNEVKYWTNTASTHLKNLQLAQAKVSNLEEQVKELKRKKPNKSESEQLSEKNKQIERLKQSSQIIAKENEKNLQKAKKATELLNKQSESVRRAQQLIKDQQQKISDLTKQNEDLDYLLKTGKNSDIIKKLQAKTEEQYKTIEELEKKGKNPVKDNKEKNTYSDYSDQEPTNKTFFCDSCQLTKQGEYIKRKADAPFEPRLHGRVCYLCSSCSPYIKELNDTKFDKENNPYKY